MVRHSPAHGWPAAAFRLGWTPRPLRPANDNRADLTEADAVLAAALRLFAASGMGAAARAEELADDAFTAGDLAAAARWVEVCRTLDDRRARRYVARRG